MKALRNFFRIVGQRIGSTSGRFLCDTCRYDYDTACDDPRRPNARTCKAYRRGGK